MASDGDRLESLIEKLRKAREAEKKGEESMEDRAFPSSEHPPKHRPPSVHLRDLESLRSAIHGKGRAEEPVKDKAPGAVKTREESIEEIQTAEKIRKMETEHVAPEPEQPDIVAPTQGIETPPKGKSHAEADLESGKKTLVDSYGETKIYKVSGKPLLYYFVPVPIPTATERTIINTIKEAATRIISISPYRIRDPEERRNVYYNQVIDILKSSPELNIPERRFDFYAESVVREMVGYGIIDPLVQDDKLEEIMIIGPKQPVYIFHREYDMMTSNIEFYDDTEIQDLINRVARQVGRRVDISSPLLDARLTDGSRANATIPPASVGGSTLTVRKFRTDPYSIVDLINLGTITIEAAAYLWLITEGVSINPSNTLISGGTGSGKTTTLNVLCAYIPASERIVSIEDTAELNLPLSHWIRLESKPPGLEGVGELTLDILTKNALRMRPDRIIVGEVRHAEAFSLFTAMNTGHRGSMGTVHANSAKETVIRVTNPPMNVPQPMMAGLDHILIQQRIHDRKKGTIRRVTEIAEVMGALEGKMSTQTIFERDPVTDTLNRTAAPNIFLRKLQEFSGLKEKEIMDEWHRREKILKKIMDSGLREIHEVATAMQKYITESRWEDVRARKTKKDH